MARLSEMRSHDISSHHRQTTVQGRSNVRLLAAGYCPELAPSRRPAVILNGRYLDALEMGAAIYRFLTLTDLDALPEGDPAFDFGGRRLRVWVIPSCVRVLAIARHD